MYNINLSTIRSFCSDDKYFKKWMNNPFIIDNDIYATDGKFLSNLKDVLKIFQKLQSI